jgi:hypothetical protein
MDARLFILTHINDACRQMTLYDDWGSPSWTDGQFIRACVLRLERGDASAWSDFLDRLDSDRDLTLAVRSLLIDQFAVLEVPESHDVILNLPTDFEPLSIHDEKHFLHLLNVWGREPVAVFPDPAVHYAPNFPHLYKTEDPHKFIPPSKESRGEIMYIEMKPGLAGPARIGRVTFSKTRKTIYYDGKKLQSLKGSGYKANYYNVESSMWYWVSKCRKDGNDALYPATVEIDEDVREEYWTVIRQQPENKHLTKFKSPGKHSKRRPC